MADTQPAALEAFARKGTAAQSAVDRLAPKPLMLELTPAAGAAVQQALNRKRDAEAKDKEAKQLVRRATELRHERDRLNSEANELLAQAVIDQDTPPLPFDEHSREAAEAMLAPAPDVIRMEIQPAGEPTRAVTVVMDRNPPPPAGMLEAAVEQIANETPEETTEREALREVAIAGMQHAYENKTPLPPGDDVEGETPGHVFTLEDTGLTITELAKAYEGFHLWPRAPEFKTDGCGRIGLPVQVANDYWAIVEATNHNNRGKTGPMVRYKLVALHTEDEWGGTVVRWPDRWREHGGPPDTCDCTGVIVLDQEDTVWVLGFMNEAVYLDVQRLPPIVPNTPPVPAPAADGHPEVDARPGPTSPPTREPDEADVEFHKAWYAKECVRRNIDDPAPLNEARLRTLFEIPAPFRYLMCDPRLNDYGVRTNPTRIHLDTIPRSVGEADVAVFEDLDGKWWHATRTQFKLGSLGGSSGPCHVPRDESERSATQLEALHRGLDELEAVADRRHMEAPAGSEAGALKRFRDGIIQFRRKVDQKAKESTGGALMAKHGGGAVAPKPKAKGKSLAGARSIGNRGVKDSPKAWYVHFNQTFKGLNPFDAPRPDDDDEVHQLYERYLHEDLSPADAARAYTNSRPPKPHKKPTKSKGAKPAVALGSYVGGLKQSLKDAPKLLAKINYDPKAKFAHPLVMECWKAGIPVREAAAKFRKDGL